MNTIKSTWYGWGTLCVAGGGAYYFAKQQINADRAARYNQERLKQERLHRLEATQPFTEMAPSRPKKKKAAHIESDGDMDITKGDGHGSEPSAEANDNTAAVSHAPEASEMKAAQRSKYEAEKPYRSKKGDRFS